MADLLNASQPIVDKNGTMEQPFRTRTIEWNNNLPIGGTGSPEGVLEAPQYSLYIDETVPLVPVTYRKMLPSSGGDRKNGWAVV